MGVSPRSRRGHAGVFSLLALALILALTASGLATSPAAAFPGAPWFEPGQPYDQNFADPAIIEVDGTYYAYATTTGGSSLPVMTSTDLVTWTAHGEALGAGPSWSPVNGAGKTNLWAPTVVELPDGSFMAAFASRTGSGARRCIATAHSASPLGPFVSPGSQPFVCETDPNGAIDPFLVVDGGVPWLIWKNEGVPVGVPGMASRRTAFWSRPLSDDGRSWRSGSSVHFLIETTEQARPWQGTVIENPAMVAYEGSWLLIYSANRYDSIAYATGFARCTSPGGPCRQPGTQPLAASNGERYGPGGPAPFYGPDGSLMLGYHGWNPPHTSYPSYPACVDENGECSDQGQRFLYIDHLCIAGATGSLFDDDGRDFCDVPTTSYYGGAVAWLAAEGLTTGISPNAYGSDGPVTRAQMATFLWRLTGEPAASSPAPFVDVPTGAFYTDAVAWLAEAGITTGTAPGVFEPGGFVTRAQMATFLWRLMDSIVVSVATTFTDVQTDSWFGPAVAWLADRDITTGTSASLYSPADPVNRAQMAALLCRLSRTTDYAASSAPTPAC